MLGVAVVLAVLKLGTASKNDGANRPRSPLL